MPKKFLYNLILLSLIFVSYFNIYGNPNFPTWRIVNIIFVLSSFFYYLKIPKKSFPLDLIICQTVFFISIIAQCLHLALIDEFGAYETTFVFSLIFLLGFSFYFHILVDINFYTVIKILMLSIFLNFIYQIFQFVSFLIGKKSWVVLLNQPDVVDTSNIYRVIGPFLGPPGFMSESGQLALFIGPFLIYLIVLNYYKILRLNIFWVLCLFVSMVITFSGGSFIQFAFLMLTFLMLYGQRLLNLRFLLFLIVLIALIFIMFQNDQYFRTVEYRVLSIFSGDSSRFRGASTYLEVFYENILFGLAPKSSRFINTDPNTFIPTLLADHGIIAGGAFLFMYFIPILLAFIRSKSKFFIMPFISLTVHLFLAYGTYTWSFIWIIYGLVFVALERQQSTISIEDNLN